MVAIKSNNPTPVAMRSFIMALAPLRLELKRFQTVQIGWQKMKLLRRHVGRASVRSSSLAPSEVLRQARGNALSKYQTAASDWLWAYAVCNAGTKAYLFEQVK